MQNFTLISHNPISKHLNVFCNNLLRFPNVTRVVEHISRSLDKISVLLRCYVVIILAWARIEGGGGEGVSNILTLRGKNALSGRDLYDGFEKRCISRAKWVIHAHYPRKSEMRVVRSILSKNLGLVNIKLISNYLSRGLRLLADLEISL